jgi:hypothetical protein
MVTRIKISMLGNLIEMLTITLLIKAAIILHINVATRDKMIVALVNVKRMNLNLANVEKHFTSRI